MEIYAEISGQILRDIEELGHNLDLPPGIVMNRKPGSRACYFECDEFSKNEIIDFFNNTGISWQVIPEERETKKDKKEHMSSKEKGGFIDFIDPWERKVKSPKKKGGFREMPDSRNF